MSDFDTVLERLLTDSAFAGELSRDPEAALSEYTLDDGEKDLLRSQVASDSHGVAAAVESRMTKSSTFGLFGSLGEWSEFGTAAGVGARQAAEAVSQGGAGGSDLTLQTGLGDAPGRDLDEVTAVSRMGDRPSTGMGDAETMKLASHVEEAPAKVQQAEMQAEIEEIKPPKGYQNRVDADGDGDWDKATYVGREDGGVDILVDLNRDGKTDFVGRDLDADWTVDEADIDRNRDGVFDKTMYDDNGDGWLDRTVWQND
jgi:hypothetical protein